jgi:hypothetical protein
MDGPQFIALGDLNVFFVCLVFVLLNKQPSLPESLRIFFSETPVALLHQDKERLPLGTAQPQFLSL